jgi:hypothetical protein
MRFSPHDTITYKPFPVTVVMIATNGISRRVRKSGMVLAIRCTVTIAAISGAPFWLLI